MDAKEKRQLDTQLLVMGLRKLEDPMLIEQLGKLVTDHDMLLGLINACDVENRSEMFEAIRPHLRFKPHMLGIYEARLKDKGSRLASQEKPIVVGKAKLQQVDRSRATGCILTLTCAKCTKFEEFYAETPVQAMTLARQKGWIRDMIKDKEVCPKCPAVRKKVGNA